MISRVENYDLSAHNTFGLKVKCALFIEYDSATDVEQIDFASLPQPVLHIGAGSNLLFTGDFPGTVLHSAIRFVKYIDMGIDSVLMAVIAGNQQIVRMDFEETAPVDTEIRDRLIETLTKKIRLHELDAVVIEDYAKGLIGQEMLDAIVSTASHEGIFTSLDPHPGNPVRTRGISLMTPNRAEAFALAGMYHTDPADDPAKDAVLQEVAAKIRREWNPDILLVTLGHQGMALYSEKEPRGFVIPTIAREVFDVSGAGDTVISAFTLYHAAGATDREAALISNQAAGIVVGKAGTATTDPAEIAASFKLEAEKHA